LCDVIGLLTNQTGDLETKFHVHKYRLDITPAQWTLYTPVVIYLWQAAWLSYGVSTVVRQTHGQFMYIVLPILPPDLYVMFSFALACNVTWLTIWQRQCLEIAMLFALLMTFTLSVCFYISVRALADYGHVMTSCGQASDVWYVRIIVQNGLAMFATWSCVAALFNMAVVLSYRQKNQGLVRSEDSVASVLALTLLFALTLGWSFFDTWLRERHLRYVFTPYVTVLLTTLGVVNENWATPGPLPVYVQVIAASTGFLLLTKALLTSLRHVFDPLYHRPHTHSAMTHDGHWIMLSS
jgi:hypothetical protein